MTLQNATQEQIYRACELVYEKITGKCWHELNEYGECLKCGDVTVFLKRITNPPLATSLDAWAEHIWPVMSYEQSDTHSTELRKVLDVIAEPGTRHTYWHFKANPLHHLEAAIIVIGTEEAREIARAIQEVRK